MELKKYPKLNIVWNVSPYDYSKEIEERIQMKAASKYGIPASAIHITPNFTISDNNGNCLGSVYDTIQDIQDPAFQLSLIKKYIELREIENVDLSLIEAIDADINSRIEFSVYEKHRRYSVKWIRWSNFLSYGEDNFFDFTHLGKLVLVNGQPANQSGKTTFAIDLIHFLLFGRVKKYKTQDKIFNKHLPEATNVEVEGCLMIDGEEYVIKRTLSRPSLSRRSEKSTTTQKVEYYKIVSGGMEELEDYIDEQQEENSVKTNKVIKESIGTEDDFDLVFSVTESNLDALIEKKDAERGKLLSRWIGLLPIEDKEVQARAKFNGEVKPHLVSNIYNKESLSQEITSFSKMILDVTDGVNKAISELSVIDGAISGGEEKKNLLLEAKRNVDADLMKIDITTLTREMDSVQADGLKRAEELKALQNEILKIGDVEFSNDEYDKVVAAFSDYQALLLYQQKEYKEKRALIEKYKTMEYCPTCHRKLDNVDNSQIIAELQQELDVLTVEGKKTGELVKENGNRLAALKDLREAYLKKNEMVMKIPAYEANIERLREKYKSLRKIKKDYELNQEAIDKNNKLDIEIRNTDALLKSKREEREVTNTFIITEKSKITSYENEIKAREELLRKIDEETIIVRHWKIYLDAIGKDGICKMILREVVPVINGRLRSMLSEVCDFNVELVISPKNEILFYLCKDGVYSDLSGASGFERTASALALRSVLGRLSVIPHINFLVADEILGRVAKENYDNMKLLIEKICDDYDFILNITHLDDFKDFCDTQISIVKENNVSKIIVEANGNVKH